MSSPPGALLSERSKSDAAIDLLAVATSSCACGGHRRGSPSPHDAVRPSHYDELGKKMVCKSGQIEVPTSVEEITADWLTRILRHKGILPPHCRVSQVDARPVGGEGQGMMAEMALLNLTFEADATSAVPSPTRAVVDAPEVEPADFRGSPNILDVAGDDGDESAAACTCSRGQRTRAACRHPTAAHSSCARRARRSTLAGAGHPTLW